VIMMRLLHTSTVKQSEGLFSISVLIDGKPYTYELPTQRDVESFLHLYKHSSGKALAFLKKRDRSVKAT
jgi:hypothetical protein